MNLSLLFICGLATTLAVSVAAVIYMTRPLRRVLVELCGNADRAEFWTVFSNVTVALVPVIFAMQYQPEAGASVPLFQIANQLKWGLVGLVVSVLVLGKVLSRYIPKPTPAPPPLPGQK